MDLMSYTTKLWQKEVESRSDIYKRRTVWFHIREGNYDCCVCSKKINGGSLMFGAETWAIIKDQGIGKGEPIEQKYPKYQARVVWARKTREDKN